MTPSHYIYIPLGRNVFKFWTALIAIVLLSSCGVLSGGSQNNKGKKETVELSERERMELTRLFIDGNKFKILGDYGQAKKFFQQALAIDPNNGAVQFEISKLYAEQGRYLESLQMGRSAYDSDPDNIWYAHFLAQLYAETGSFDKSVEIYKEILKRQPEEYENYFNLANLLSAQGKHEDALKIFDNLEEMLGPNEEISMQRQLIYLEQKNFDLALKEVTALIDANPSEIRYYGMKAEILQQMNRKEEARELYEIMLFENPENGLVLLALYEMSKAAGEKEKANEYLQKSFASRDLGIDVKVNILLNYLSGKALKDSPEFVIALAENLEKAHPNEAKTYAIQGDIYYNLNRIEDARTKFRQAIKLDANRPPIWQQVLTISSQLNDFDAMLEESQEAVELFPMQPIFYLFKGVAHLQVKEIDEAIETLESGVALVIENPGLQAQFFSSLGDAYHEAEMHEKAFKSYDKALEIDDSNALVLNNYAYYLSLRGERLEKAESMAKKANNLAPDTPSFQDTYGWVLYMRGNYRNALFWIEEALKSGAENDPVVLEHHGDVLFALDRKADAVRSWQQAIDAGGDADSLMLKINSETVGE